MKNTRRMALVALMFALVIIFTFVPIQFGTVTLGLMILPVLIIAQLEDFKTTMIVTIFMALANFLAWYTVKAGALLAPVFQNPLVCIFPRVLIGINAYFTGKLMKKLLVKPIYDITTLDDGTEKKVLQNKIKVDAMENLSSLIATAVGVLTNTLFVGLMAVLLFNGRSFISGAQTTTMTPQFIVGCFSINFVIEIICFSVIVPPIVYALKKVSSVRF
ncbi:MAG: ECF transporter S component [Clostridia bacterium]